MILKILIWLNAKLLLKKCNNIKKKQKYYRNLCYNESPKIFGNLFWESCQVSADLTTISFNLVTIYNDKKVSSINLLSSKYLL